MKAENLKIITLTLLYCITTKLNVKGFGITSTRKNEFINKIVKNSGKNTKENT